MLGASEVFGSSYNVRNHATAVVCLWLCRGVTVVRLPRSQLSLHIVTRWVVELWDGYVRRSFLVIFGMPQERYMFKMSLNNFNMIFHGWGSYTLLRIKLQTRSTAVFPRIRFFIDH